MKYISKFMLAAALALTMGLAAAQSAKADPVAFTTTGTFSQSGTNVATFTSGGNTTTLTFTGTTNSLGSLVVKMTITDDFARVSTTLDTSFLNDY